jgi:glycerol-3-phosphate acyltransferase PlsY
MRRGLLRSPPMSCAALFAVLGHMFPVWLNFAAAKELLRVWDLSC